MVCLKKAIFMKLAIFRFTKWGAQVVFSLKVDFRLALRHRILPKLRRTANLMNIPMVIWLLVDSSWIFVHCSWIVYYIDTRVCNADGPLNLWMSSSSQLLRAAVNVIMHVEILFEKDIEDSSCSLQRWRLCIGGWSTRNEKFWEWLYFDSAWFPVSSLTFRLWWSL